jgi:hypothetical protein
MKKLISLAVLFSVFNLHAQDELYKRELPLNENERIEFIEVIEVPGKTQDELYISAKTWIAEDYNSANDVIQMDEKKAGKVIVKGIYSYTNWIKYKLHHILKIYVKENKARISLSGLVLKYSYQNMEAENPMRKTVIDGLYKKNGKPNKGAIYQKEQLLIFWETTKNRITAGLNKKGTDEDDW